MSKEYHTVTEDRMPGESYENTIHVTLQSIRDRLSPVSYGKIAPLLTGLIKAAYFHGEYMTERRIIANQEMYRKKESDIDRFLEKKPKIVNI